MGAIDLRSGIFLHEPRSSSRAAGFIKIILALPLALPLLIAVTAPARAASGDNAGAADSGFIDGSGAPAISAGAKLKFVPKVIDFGKIIVGQSSTMGVAVTNTSTSSSVTFTAVGGPSAPFSLDS